MFKSLRKPSPWKAVGAGLLESARGAARAPALFGEGRIPDTLDGRFESMALHVALLIERLIATGEAATPASQALFDAFMADLDAAVRELGAEDLGVAKRVRRMAEAFYGRLGAYRTALAQADDAALRAALSRNVFATRQPRDDFLEALAVYVRSCHDLQRAQSTAALEAGEPPIWGKLPA